MKNLLILFLIYLCLVGNLQAQGNVLEKRVTFQYKEATLESILKDLDQRYGIKFSYVNNLVPLSQKINAQVKEQPLKDGLELILAATDIDYQLVNGQVVLRKNQLKKPVEQTKPVEVQQEASPASNNENKSSSSY
ncbi:hypothetical protein BH23BAC1_BH23BAC1_05460 [soil metagenome]